MTEKPTHVYLVTNKDTKKKRLIRARGPRAALNHAADTLFDVETLNAGQAIDAIHAGVDLETAGEEADDPTPTTDGGTDVATA